MDFDYPREMLFLAGGESARTRKRQEIRTSAIRSDANNLALTPPGMDVKTAIIYVFGALSPTKARRLPLLSGDSPTTQKMSQVKNAAFFEQNERAFHDQDARNRPARCTRPFWRLGMIATRKIPDRPDRTRIDPGRT